MQWVIAVIGAFLGLAVGSGGSELFGLGAGALLGWQGARLAALRTRLEQLEKALREESIKRVAATAARSAREQPATFSAPVAAEATETPRTAAAVEASALDDSARRSDQATEPTISEPSPPTSRTAPSPAPSAARPYRPPPLPARAAPEEAMPSIGERLQATLRSWLFEGNVPVKLGVLLLFFGLAAAMRYAVEQGLVSFPIELRLSAIAAAALAGLLWGWRNRLQRPAFGLALQGGAVGVLLLTVFAAFRLYGLLPAGLAFGLVIVLVAGAALLALLQNAVSLAVLGFVGGYLGPVLISTGSGNHVALFSYYAVLNAAVFGIAWVRPWRALNLVGFGFTFIVGTLWGARYYRPELLPTVEPFLILFFLFYVAIAVLYALREGGARRALVDGTLVFGTPLLAFPLQAALLRDDPVGLAWSAIAVATLYAALAWWLLRRRRVPLLGQSFAALALGFATLAVPLALSARWTSASWAVEGVALAWLGLRQRSRLPQLAGWTLQLLAFIAYGYALVDGGWRKTDAELLVLNGHCLSVVLMAGAAWLLSWLYEREGAGRGLVWPPFLLGCFWWCVAGLRELDEFFSDRDPALLLVAFAALSATLAAALRGLIRWPRLGWIGVVVAICGLPLALATEADMGALDAVREHSYWLGWFAALLFTLWRLRSPRQRGLSIAHVAVLASASLVYGLAMHGWAERAALAEGWRFVATLAPLLGLLLATWQVPRLGAWPLAEQFPDYRLRWFIPASIAVAIAWIAALGSSGDSAPLPYLPLLNPIELFQLAALLVAAGLARRAGARDLLALAAGLGLLFATFAALRGVHQLGGAPWSPDILDDRVAQAALTVVWSLAGVVGWVVGSRRRHWGVWLAGATLMGIVLLKLLLVDRRYFGDLAGIVSFMAVGGLLVIVGRIAPTPPRSGTADDEPPPQDRPEATS